MKNLLVVLSTLLLLPVVSLAKYVAVLETISDKDLLTLQERQYLTDVLRGQAVRELPAEQNWTIMTRENINVMLPPGKSIEDCEGSCLAETGKNIAADFVAQARVSKFGSSLAISAELYETAGNKLVASFAGRGESVVDLEKIIKEQASPFFKKIRNESWSGGFGGFDSGRSFSFAGTQKFIVEIETTPAGAIPTVDGKAIPKCTSTPCKVPIEAGEHRLVVSMERYDDMDTLVNISSNNQKIQLNLIPNVGKVVFAPVMSDAWKQKYPLSIMVDDEFVKADTIELQPGMHSVRITHPCYDPMEFQAAIQKGKTEIFADTLKVGIGGVELEVEKNGEPVAVPVYVDGKDAGSTPFAGEVPVCAEITVGEDKQVVPVMLKWHEVVKANYPLKDAKQLQDDATRAKAAAAYAELDGKDTVVAPVSKPEEKPAPQKRFWAGVFVAGTYNDFYGTKFGLTKLGSSSDYTLDVEGADGLLGNYWGPGVNGGLSGLFLINSYLGLRADLGVAFRQGKGRSDVTVKLFWDDASRSPEKADLEIEYSEKQLNIDVPVLFRAMVPNVMYVEAGPVASFNLYSHHKSTVKEYGSQTFREDGGLNVFECGAAFGIGTMRYIRKSILDINVRFFLGLTPLSDADDAPKTWQGQFNVTYWFL